MKFSIAVAAISLVVLSACASPHPSPPQLVGTAVHKPTPTLADAIRRSTALGPADASTTVFLSFGLKVRNQAQLDVLVGSGKTVSASQYAARFGPDPVLARQAVAALEAAGLRAIWQPPSSLIAADGAAPVASRLLGVDIENYRLPDGTTFYATLDQPHLPATIAAASSGVSGLDSYRRDHGYAVRPGGLTPVDVLSYYNLKPLRDAGLDGSGETIMLPEIDDLPNMADLDKFATKFGLPPFEPVLTLRRDPSWGSPEKAQGETVLDLEILHEVAPNAKLVVYFSSPDFGHSDRAFDQMVSDHLGSIISESLGSCEPDTPSGARDNYTAIQDRAVALGMSHFVASGDSGAYTCGVDHSPAGSFPSTLPSVTAVGGTTVFESIQGVYFKEYAWSSPIDQSGGGGGASVFYAMPDYQKNEAQPAARGERQVPDVAADADPLTGFHIVFGGRDAQIGGTSAATPLWAATAALIDQDLKQKGMREIGFANPALYWMGENSSHLSPKPFHDVSAGNNLFYDAGTGWDFATGWGSMDAAALDAAWVRYIKGGGG
ncbi:MAG TPA: S53 family peptidase [Candidatus Dormibacteraeota bacterium]|nr:S53 family peptidase [Candidatus Dormibacteraeota bacterium]